MLLFLRSEGYIRLKADSAIPSAALYGIYCMWCSDNAYKPRSARTVSMTLKKHADEFGLEHDNHIQNALASGSTASGASSAGRAAGYMSSDTKFSILSIPSIPKTRMDGMDGIDVFKFTDEGGCNGKNLF